MSEPSEKFLDALESLELTRYERRERLIDSGCDPDALYRRIQLAIAETKANMEMDRALEKLR